MDEEVAKMHEQVATRTGSYHKLRHGGGLIFMTTSDMGCRRGGLLWVNHVWEVGGASMPEPRVLENPKLMGWVMSY